MAITKYIYKGQRQHKKQAILHLVKLNEGNVFTIHMLEIQQ